MPRVKVCGSCKKELPFSSFYRRAKGKGSIDGYWKNCKPCSGGNGSVKIYYRVIYDPLDSFLPTSAFTRQEIMDMLNMEYLAIGTLFRKGDRYYEVTKEMMLMSREKEQIHRRLAKG
jgi:hypothetical protein